MSSRQSGLLFLIKDLNVLSIKFDVIHLAQQSDKQLIILTIHNYCSISHFPLILVNFAIFIEMETSQQALMTIIRASVIW